MYYGDLEGLLGRPREHLEFALRYLAQRKFIDRSDGSQIAITAEGVDHLEENSAVRHRVPINRCRVVRYWFRGINSIAVSL